MNTTCEFCPVFPSHWSRGAFILEFLSLQKGFIFVTDFLSNSTLADHLSSYPYPSLRLNASIMHIFSAALPMLFRC